MKGKTMTYEYAKASSACITAILQSEELHEHKNIHSLRTKSEAEHRIHFAMRALISVYINEDARGISTRAMQKEIYDLIFRAEHCIHEDWTLKFELRATTEKFALYAHSHPVK